jgi:hypothetical protein
MFRLQRLWKLFPRHVACFTAEIVFTKLKQGSSGFVSGQVGEQIGGLVRGREGNGAGFVAGS